MIVNAYIDGRPYSFNTEDERQTIGEGGEAVVMKWAPHAEFIRRHGNRKFAVKLFFTDTPVQLAAVTVRQTKLRNVPRGVPANVVTPLEFATDYRGQIIGYVMPLVEDVVPLVKLMDPRFREANGITQTHIVHVLRRLHDTVSGLHRVGVVIGDFNDKNVLVQLRTGDVHVIDFDSAQWGSWPCLAATPEFSDPTLLDQDHNLRRGASYSMASDWYSYTVIAYQLLTLTHPYRDGVHRPGSGKPRKRFPERVTIRLSVFSPDVHLDKSAHRPASLPDELGRLMRAVFVTDHRVSPFPLDLLTSFQWMTCPRCARQHGRATCPNRKCSAPGIQNLRPTAAQAPSGPTATATAHDATYLAMASLDGKLRYVFYANGAYRREDGSEVWRREYLPSMSVLVAGDRTVFTSGSGFAVVNGDIRKARSLTTHSRFGKTTVAANSRHVYWVNGSSLVRDDSRRDYVTLGTVTPHMTSVWVGERFGLAMVQAGFLTRILTFDTERPGTMRTCHLPPETGTVVDATCVISDSFAWLRITSRAQSGTVIHRCYVLDPSAQLRATAEAQQGTGTWLDSFTASALPVKDKLLIPLARTGIARIGLRGSSLHGEGTYRAAASHINDTRATVGIGLTQEGLFHVGRKAIQKVTTTS